jgi:quercetin dioxygenase-like cupin family protein
VFENEYIHVLEYRLKPGERVTPSLPGDCLLAPFTAADLRINGGGARLLDPWEIVASDEGIASVKAIGDRDDWLVVAHFKGPGPAEPPTVPTDNAMLVEPEAYKLIFENRRARVARVTSAPGDTTIMHSHPPHVFRYMLAPNVLRIIGPNGDTRIADIPAGRAFWREDGGHHETVNIGDSAGLLILIEVR